MAIGDSAAIEYAGIIDSKHLCPSLSAYYFIGSSASTVVNGFLINTLGERTGTYFTATVTTGAAQSIADMYGSALPADATGAYMDFSTDARFDILTDTATTSIATIKAYLLANKANAPTLSAAKRVPIGRAV